MASFTYPYFRWAAQPSSNVRRPSQVCQHRISQCCRVGIASGRIISSNPFAYNGSVQLPLYRGYVHLQAKGRAPFGFTEVLASRPYLPSTDIQFSAPGSCFSKQKNTFIPLHLVPDNDATNCGRCAALHGGNISRQACSRYDTSE